MATNGTRNRNAGHAWEREGVTDWLPIFPDIATSRLCSRLRDSQKIDLCNKDEAANGRVPYNLQYKSYSTAVPYPKLLAEIPKVPGIVNVVMHKQTAKSKTGNRFMTQDKFAITYYADFLLMAKKVRAFAILEEYVDFIPAEERKELEARLTALGI